MILVGGIGLIWRWIAAGLALALGVLAILFWRNESARANDVMMPARPVAGVDDGIMAPPPEAPVASQKTREERRFNRYDKDRSDQISREEYLASRRKAFTKLDINGDGKLSFDEWSVKTIDKFAKADMDRSSTLTRKEFATTAVKRKPVAQSQAKCPPAARDGDDGDGTS